MREGSQRRARMRSATCKLCIVSAILVFGSAYNANASELKPNAEGGVSLPREVLPWRRSAEDAAANLLATARHSLLVGNKDVAIKQLERLQDTYSDTHAANDGAQALARLRREQMDAAVGRRGLGIQPKSTAELRRPDAARQDPVAGWQAIVVPRPTDLHEALIEAAGDRVFFTEGSTALGKRARDVLKKQARWLKQQPLVRVKIVGHSDDNGSEQTNMRISHDRAARVRKQLIQYGVSPKRLHIFSHGRGRPIAICTVATCGAQNRRVVTQVEPVQRRAEAAFD